MPDAQRSLVQEYQVGPTPFQTKGYQTFNIQSNTPQSTLLRYSVDTLCKSKKLKEILQLVFTHPLERSHCALYSKVIQICANLKSKRPGQLIHGHLIRNGFPLNTYLTTALIVFYAKVSEMSCAGKLFAKLHDRGVVSWTALISGYEQNGDPEEALRVFSAMHKEGVKANQFTYGSTLHACTSLMCLEGGKQVQGCVQKGRFSGNLFVQSALLDLHSKCGSIEDACQVFEMMKDRDLVSWNAMIRGYAIQGLKNDAFLMFRLMLREGMIPDSFSLGSILRACGGDDALVRVSLIHGYIIRCGFDSHGTLSSFVIDAYINCESLVDAKLIYKRMQNKDIISCTALISGCARKNRNNTDVLDLFNEVHRNVGIDGVLLCAMLNICANTASLTLGRQLHAILLKSQNLHDIALGNSLIDMYSKSGAIKDAKSAFHEMKEKNIISWTSLITGYGRHGYGCEAVALYERMEKGGVKPNDITLLSLLFACSHNGLTAEGWRYFSRMVSEHNIFPRDEHYSCLVDLFGRAGWLEEAYGLAQKMTDQHNSKAWNALLASCSTYGNTSLGEIAAKRLLDLEPENPVNYVVLAGLYAASSSWDVAKDTWVLMKERRSQKAPGYSIFEPKN